jgi:glutamyl-tRNA reductase
VSLVVIGLNHRTVPLEILERVTLAERALPKALLDLATRTHVSEAVVVSTCNRTEVYARAERFHGAYEDVRSFLTDIADLPYEAFADHLYTLYDADAARHLFRVAAGLDSAVLGEHEILGQVRRSWEVALEERTAGTLLNPLFRHAVEVGKRARTDTSIARHTTSVSHAAVELVVARLDDLRSATALVLGAGEMGEGVARSLAASGLGRLLVANRTMTRATALAGRLGGQGVHLEDLRAALAGVDVLLTCTGSTQPLLGADDLAEAMAARQGRPLLVVDIAVPRDVDPSASTVPGVTLLDMDALRSFADAGLASRRREVTAVEAIIDEELDRYLDTLATRAVEPMVAALHQRAEQIRTAELERLGARLAHLDERDRRTIEALTTGIVGKLLRDPTVRLKDAAGSARGERLAEALRDLFDL